MKKIRIFLIALLLAVVLLAGARCYFGNRGFTPWMSLAELNAFMDTFASKHPGEPNYWDQGHWITAVDGRWHAGIPQYRIRYGDAPKNQGYWWYWFINQDQKGFNDKIHNYADQGFIMAYHSRLRWPDGACRYQAVWHKYAKTNPPEPAPLWQFLARILNVR